MRIEVTLDGIHRDHAVADGRATSERDAMSWMFLIKVEAFHIEVHGTLTATGLNACYTLHFCRCGQIFAVGTFVDEDMIYPQLVKNQAVILLVLRQQVFQLLFVVLFLLLKCLSNV